jgi:hypothetical protein
MILVRDLKFEMDRREYLNGRNLEGEPWWLVTKPVRLACGRVVVFQKPTALHTAYGPEHVSAFEAFGSNSFYEEFSNPFDLQVVLAGAEWVTDEVSDAV